MISVELAQALAAGRAQFNARVVEARHRFPALDPGAFRAFLESAVDAVVRAVAAVSPDRTGTVVVACYDMALELVGQTLAGPGARTSNVDRVWTSLGPAYARLVAGNPVEVLGALSNAALNIGKVPGARIDEWLAQLEALAARVGTLAELRALGQLLAWRAGLAHYRAGALDAAQHLPGSLALAALDAPPGSDATQVLERLRADPWTLPDGSRGGAISIGSFVGFGGSFRAPPELRAREDGFLTRSAGRFSLLQADAFGAVLLPATKEEFEQADARTAKLATLTMPLPFPVLGAVAVGNAHAVAIASPYSFAIRVQPLTTQ